MASYRYRALIPAKQIGASVNEGEVDVLVFSKPTLQDLRMAQVAKGEAKIIVDICDDHFAHKELGPIYKEFLSLADGIVCPSEVMAQRVFEICAKEACVIPDPHEEEHQEPHATGDRRLWFGHQSNLKDIKQYPWIGNLKILTGDEWSNEAQTQALKDSNIVVLPTTGVYKSANRLVNSVRAGCFVVATDIPSYKEFRQMMWTGAIGQGLQYSKCFVNELNDRVRECQKYITKFSPQAIGNRWASYLASI